MNLEYLSASFFLVLVVLSDAFILNFRFLGPEDTFLILVGLFDAFNSFFRFLMTFLLALELVSEVILRILLMADLSHPSCSYLIRFLRVFAFGFVVLK